MLRFCSVSNSRAQAWHVDSSHGSPFARENVCSLQTTLYAYNSRDYFAKRNVEQIFLQLCAAFQFNVESYRLMVSVGF